MPTRHHSVHPGAVGHTQAGTQVVRVGHAVQHQHEWRALHFFQHLVQRMARRQRVHAGHHALVARATGHGGQSVIVGLDQLDAGVACAFDELAHAAVAPAAVEMNFSDGLRRGLQPHGDGMEAEEDFGAHGKPAMELLGMGRGEWLKQPSFNVSARAGVADISRAAPPRPSAHR